MAQLTQNLLGQSPAWLATLDAISGLAAIERPVLVVGERGTGKTLVAGRLHFLSPRWEQSWQAVNCAALGGDNLDAHLFGSGKLNHESLLERAEGGTLFLDNIDAAPLYVQEKLLSMIETGKVDNPDRGADISVDVRILAASATDLPAQVTAGRFSADLMDVLAFDVITLPPLRNRKADIILLAEHFAARMVTDLGEESFAGFSAEVLEFLGGYTWPGNIRELKNVVERAVGRAWNEDGGLSAPVAQVNIDPFEAPWRLGDAPTPIKTASIKESADQVPTPPFEIPTTGFTQRADAFELSLIQEALAFGKNHQGKAAKHLGLSYHQFRGLLRKHGLKK